MFLNAKCKRLFSNKLKAAKLAWTALYRKAHKKDQSTEAARRKRRSNKVSQARSIVGASLEVIQKRRNEKSDVRAAARENALRCVPPQQPRLACALTRRASAPQRDQGAREEGEGGEAGRQEVRGCQAEGVGAQGCRRRTQGWQGWWQALKTRVTDTCPALQRPPSRHTICPSFGSAFLGSFVLGTTGGSVALISALLGPVASSLQPCVSGTA